MRIDGKAFLSLLGVCTLALAVATVWLWPRLAGSGAKPLAGRISLLLGTQLSLAATLLFTVNALGGFYTSWGQLFGTASAKYTLADRGPADPARYDGQSLDATSPGKRGAPPGAQPTYAGSLNGLRSGLTAGLQIYLPADYSSPQDAHRRFPVEVVDLTGSSQGLNVAGYQQVAETYQVMVVVVDAAAPSTASAPDIPGVNVPGGAQGRLFWAQDLQGALRAHYRVAPYAAGWGVAGVGQDGTAAVNLAIQDPAHYGLAAAAGDWTHTDGQQSWPGIDTYLASVPAPNASLLYDPGAGAVPQKLQASSGALRITRQPGLTLAEELDWLGRSMDANAGVAG
jgi:hypothetical protein